MYLGLLAGLTKGDAGDTGAQEHLRGVWSTPSGKAIDFWPKS